MKRRNIIIAALIALTIGTLLWRLGDHDLGWRSSESFDFSQGGTQISGTLWLPNTDPRAAIVFVHGDGPQDRSQSGTYAPLFNALLDHGIAVASWDKPGIGGSTGNWLAYSMSDRADIVHTALGQLKARFPDLPAGALGVSQAGWVLPKLTPGEADFLVLIGAAVSWREQGTYFGRVRLGQKGLSESEIAQELARIETEDQRIFGPNATVEDAPTDMTAERWGFVQRNIGSDAREDLARLDLPVLAMWGADDLNVNAVQDHATYQGLIGQRHPANRIMLIPNATHGLMKSGPYNYQLAAQWPWHSQLRFLAEGRYAYAPGAITEIANWITTLDR